MSGGRYAQAELLVAIWRLGGDANADIPTAGGRLDAALKAHLAELPAALAGRLTFSVGSVGLRCLDLPDLLLAAAELELASDRSPEYLTAHVKLDASGASMICVENDVPSARARIIGAMLRDHALS